MQLTHLDAERRYEVLRKEALASAKAAYKKQGMVDIDATLINHKSLQLAKSWGLSKLRIKDWDWLEGYSFFKFRYPKRFEIALWQTHQLIGLSMGRPTYHAASLRLDVVEASPKDLGERPQIMNLVLVAYGIYARLIGASEIRIMNPVNDKIKNYYTNFGYTYLQGKDYLFKRVL